MKSSRQTMHPGNASDRRPIALEPLEARRLLSTVQLMSDGSLRYTGTDAAEDVLFRRLDNGRLEVVENGQVVFSAAAASVTGLDFFGNGGNDAASASANLAGINKFFDGGPGNDRLSGGTRGSLGGGTGNDTLYADGPNAYVYPGPGADVIRGGTVTYADRGDYLFLALDGLANDGAPGERDNILFAHRLVGGQGNDVIHGSTGPDDLYGAGGNDTIWGNNGNDAYHGGDGNDTLVASGGADLMSGEAGVDTADYASRFNPVRVTLDNVANDGERYEADDVRADVENVTGGRGNDVLTGSAASNVLRGGAGADQLYGRDGNDVLRGGDGADALFGDGGVDALFGGAGDDVLLGRDGGVRDYLNGGYGTDTAAKDVVDAADGVERYA